MNYETFESWIQGYIHAWTTNDAEDIGRLFAKEADYYTGPFDAPWQGRDAIIAGWLDRRDDFRNVRFRYEILAVENDVGVMRGWTTYLGRPLREYSNIWVVRFDGRELCTEFTEWWIERG